MFVSATLKTLYLYCWCLIAGMTESYCSRTSGRGTRILRVCGRWRNPCVDPRDARATAQYVNYHCYFVAGEAAVAGAAGAVAASAAPSTFTRSRTE